MKTGEDGFSLVEVIVAITVFALFASGIGLMLAQSLKLGRGGRDRVEAASAAESQLELVQSSAAANWSKLALGTTSFATATGAYDKSYTVTQTVTLVTSTDPTIDPCVGTGAQVYKRVHEAVTWENMGVTPTVVTDTDIAAKPSDLDPTTSIIPIRVTGANGSGRANVSVAISGASNATQLTESHGCALFVGVPSGSYTATLNSGGVSWVGANPAVVSLGTVSPGQRLGVTTIPYDTPTLLTLTGTTALTSHPAAVPPVASGLSVYPSPAGLGGGVAEANISTLGYVIFPGSAAASTVALPPEFPFTDYNEWLGGCPDADPASYGVSRSIISATPPVTPGSTLSVPTHLAPISVTVSGIVTPVVGDEVYAISNSAACTTGSSSRVTDPFTGLSLAGHEVLDLGAVGASKVLYSSLPYGKWQLETGKLLVTAKSASTQISPNAALGSGLPEPATAFTIALL